MSIMENWSVLEHQLILAAAKLFIKNKTPQERKKLEEEKFNFMRKVLIRKGYDRSADEIKKYYQNCVDSHKVKMEEEKNPGSAIKSSTKRKHGDKELSQPVTKIQRKTTLETNPNNFIPEDPRNLKQKEVETQHVAINENKNAVNDIVDEETGSSKAPEENPTSTKRIITEDRRNYLRQRANKYMVKPAVTEGSITTSIDATANTPGLPCTSRQEIPDVTEDKRGSVTSPDVPTSPDQEMPEYTSDEEVNKKPVISEEIKAVIEPQSNCSKEDVEQLVQSYLSSSSPTTASVVEFSIKQEPTSTECLPVNNTAALLEGKESSQTPKRCIRRKRCKKDDIIGRIARIEKELIRRRKMDKAILNKLNQIFKSVNKS